MRRRLVGAAVYVGLGLSPVRVPPWRLDPSPPPAAMLSVGLPVRMLRRRAAPSPDP